MHLMRLEVAARSDATTAVHFREELLA